MFYVLLCLVVWLVCAIIGVRQLPFGCTSHVTAINEEKALVCFVQKASMPRYPIF